MSSARPLSRDTHPQAEKIQLGLFRRMPAWKKLQLAEDGNRTTRMLAASGLRRRHPGASEAEIQRRLMDLMLGWEIARRAYGPLTAIEGGPADGNP